MRVVKRALKRIHLGWPTRCANVSPKPYNVAVVVDVVDVDVDVVVVVVVVVVTTNRRPRWVRGLLSLVLGKISTRSIQLSATTFERRATHCPRGRQFRETVRNNIAAWEIRLRKTFGTTHVSPPPQKKTPTDVPSCAAQLTELFPPKPTRYFRLYTFNDRYGCDDGRLFFPLRVLETTGTQSNEINVKTSRSQTKRTRFCATSHPRPPEVDVSISGKNE